MYQYIYIKKLMSIFNEFAQERSPKTGKRMRSADSINSNYKHRVNEFIQKQLSTERNYQIEINEISSKHINEFLDSVQGDKYNYYLALSSFFRYTYQKKYTNDIAIGIIEPEKATRAFPIIPDEDCAKILAFIKNEKMNFEHRLLLGFHIFTGLSLKVILSVELLSSFSENAVGNDFSVLWVDSRDKRCSIPIKVELQQLLQENYKRLMDKHQPIDPKTKLFDVKDGTVISGKVSRITKKITGISYSPKSFEKTFKKHALKIECNPYLISELTMSSISSVAMFIDKSISEVEQKRILAEMYVD